LISDLPPQKSGKLQEYILCYSKQKIDNILAPLNEEQIKEYNKNKDGKYKVRGGYVTQPLATGSKDERPNLRYPIFIQGKEVWPDKQWLWSKERTEEALKNDELILNETGGKLSIRTKQYLKDENGVIRKTKPLSIFIGPYNQEGTKDIISTVGGGIFDFPKPSALIEYLLSISTDENQNNDHIILDSFSGSCTTAHAVLNLNKQDNGLRKFIMVQLPEPCDENSEAFKAGYKTIADIGKARIRRVIQKIKVEQAAKAKEDAEALPGMAESRPALDLGFKVFKLDKSNFKIWDGADPDISEEKLARQLELHIDHINPRSSAEDALYELLLKAGYKLTETVMQKELAGNTVFSVADGELLICLENQITRELIDAVAETEPARFICLDRAFHGNDQLKANAVQTFEARNQGRDKSRQIVFRTV